MSKDKNKRNKGRDTIGDYFKTNIKYAKENRERQSQEEQPKKLRNLNGTEKAYLAVIILGLIGIVVRYVIL